MRELKFRIWIKDEERYYDEADEESYMISPNGDVIYTSEAYEEDGEWCRDTVNVTKDVVVEQYTGLKDKNGEKIYEGDRIKIEGSDTVYTVEYGRGVWVARFGDESGDNICLFHYVKKDIVLYAEVIGNIHENPELLDVKKEG